MAGKRYEAETGLVLFGRRFYEPVTGRWITQDPAGLDAGPNLYAYLCNSPLVHYDAYGMSENAESASFFETMRSESSLFLRAYTGAGHNPLVQSLGHLIYKASWHMIPIPVAKDIPRAAGYYMMHGSFKYYTMSYNEPHSKVITGNEEGGNALGGHCSANGFDTTRYQGYEFGKQLHHTITMSGSVTLTQLIMDFFKIHVRRFCKS